MSDAESKARCNRLIYYVNDLTRNLKEDISAEQIRRILSLPVKYPETPKADSVKHRKYHSGRHGLKTRSSYWQLLPYIRPVENYCSGIGAYIGTVFWPVLAWLAGRIAGYIGQGNVGAIAQPAGLSAVIFWSRSSAVRSRCADGKSRISDRSRAPQASLRSLTAVES